MGPAGPVTDLPSLLPGPPADQLCPRERRQPPRPWFRLRCRARGVLGEDGFEVTSGEGEQVVQALSACSRYESFRDGVRSRRAMRVLMASMRTEASTASK